MSIVSFINFSYTVSTIINETCLKFNKVRLFKLLLSTFNVYLQHNKCNINKMKLLPINEYTCQNLDMISLDESCRVYNK